MAILRFQEVGFKVTSMPTNRNYESENGQDVLGYSFSDVTKGVHSLTVEPLTIDGNDDFSKRLDYINTFGQQGTDIKGKFMFLYRYKTITGLPFAFMQEANIIPQDFGTDTGSLKASALIELVGPEDWGTFDVSATSIANRFISLGGNIPAMEDFTYTSNAINREDYRLYYVVED